MAIVPIYGPRQVSTAPLPAARKTAAKTDISAGVGVETARANLALEQGRAAGVVGEAGSRLGAAGVGLAMELGAEAIRTRQDEAEHADEVALLHAQRVLGEWINKRLYDREKGAFTKSGPDSFALPEDVAGEFGQIADGLASGLTTDAQRAAFAKLASREALDLDLRLRRHVYDEMRRYEAEELQATVTNARNSAIANAADPRRVGTELQTAIAAIRTHGPRLGLGPEEIKQQIEAVRTETHVGVIESLLAQDLTKSAEIYFEETKDQITGAAQTRVEKALEEGTIEKQAKEQAEQIIRAGGTLAQQREKAAAIDNPQVSKAVLQRIEHEDAVNEKIRRDAEESDLRKAYDIVERTGSVDGIDPALRTRIAEHMPGVRDAANARARGVPIETNWSKYYVLMTKAGEKPDEFIKENLMAYRAELGEAEFKQLVALQLSLRSGDTKAAEKELGGFRTKSQIFDDTLTGWGYDVNAKPETPQGKAIAQVRRLLDQRIEAAQQPDISGRRREVTNIEIQTTLDQIMAVTDTIPGSAAAILHPFIYDWSDKTKRIVDFTIADVPAAARNAIRLELLRHGIPVNDETILNVFVERRTKLR